MPTKVFISWSGELSKTVAESIRQWLPGVLQFVKPYFTPDDIEKGSRWGPDITKELDASEIGVICLTKDNLLKPWILFEAGALSKSFDKAKVCTLLFDVDTTDLTGPLTIFQHTKFEKADFKKLVKSVNAAGGDAKLEDFVFDFVFDMWWPKLEETISRALGDHKPKEHSSSRSERDILEEILELSRLNTRCRANPRDIQPEFFFELFDGLHEFAIMAATGEKEMLPRALRHIERPLYYLSRLIGSPEIEERFIMMRKELEFITAREMNSDLRRIRRSEAKEDQS